jgi:hypothetical protein
MVNCCSSPPSPVSRSPSPLARSTNIEINCSSVTAPTDPAAGSCSTVVSVVIWRLSLDQQIRRYLYSPACGRDYVPAQISDEDCTGGGHRVWRHDGRCADVVVPPRSPGCAPVPFDPDARQVGWRTAR